MAVAPLQASRLSTQLEGLADDVDLAELDLLLQGGKEIPIRELLVEPCGIERTIEGPSTLTLTLNDRDRWLLQSGALSPAQVERGVDVSIDGLWFRLVAHNKSGDTLTLTFEDREVVLLRRYPLKTAPKTWSRAWSTADVTRTVFARGLVDDVKELAIRFVATPSKNPKGSL